MCVSYRENMRETDNSRKTDVPLLLYGKIFPHRAVTGPSQICPIWTPLGLARFLSNCFFRFHWINDLLELYWWFTEADVFGFLPIQFPCCLLEMFLLLTQV